jgi:hypothetical protein
MGFVIKQLRVDRISSLGVIDLQNFRKYSGFQKVALPTLLRNQNGSSTFVVSFLIISIIFLTFYVRCDIHLNRNINQSAPVSCCMLVVYS